MPPAYTLRFRLTVRKIGTFHRREWCSAQRIRITMIAGGNHSIISMNASPTVFFSVSETDCQTPICRLGWDYSCSSNISGPTPQRGHS